MNIQSNLEDKIIDSLTLEPYKDVQRTNCKHHFSLVSAIKLFGEMKEGACTNRALCPRCKHKVKKYKPDPKFQSLVDEALKSGKIIKPPVPSAISSQVPAVVLSSLKEKKETLKQQIEPSPLSINSSMVAPIAPKQPPMPKMEDLDAPPKTKSEPFQSLSFLNGNISNDIGISKESESQVSIINGQVYRNGVPVQGVCIPGITISSIKSKNVIFDI